MRGTNISDISGSCIYCKRLRKQIPPVPTLTSLVCAFQVSPPRNQHTNPTIPIIGIQWPAWLADPCTWPHPSDLDVWRRSLNPSESSWPQQRCFGACRLAQWAETRPSVSTKYMICYDMLRDKSTQNGRFMPFSLRKSLGINGNQWPSGFLGLQKTGWFSPKGWSRQKKSEAPHIFVDPEAEVIRMKCAVCMPSCHRRLLSLANVNQCQSPASSTDSTVSSDVSGNFHEFNI